MKCFIHGAVEAVAACRQCGKGMCSNCSAYSGHTGICPACKKTEHEREYACNEEKKKSLIWSIVGWSFVGVALCWTIIGLIVGAVKVFNRVRERNKLKARNEYLAGEIAKLNNALKQGGAGI